MSIIALLETFFEIGKLLSIVFRLGAVALRHGNYFFAEKCQKGKAESNGNDEKCAGQIF